MDTNDVVIDGTLTEHGSLVLDAKPNLPPGRVQVVLRPSPRDSAEADANWWATMQRIRANLEATGHQFLDDDEMAERLRINRDDEEDERVERMRREDSETFDGENR